MKGTRHTNKGLRKICGCPRLKWTKCPHGWYLNYKPKEGPHYRLSIDREVGRHVAGKTEAESIAGDIRTAIRAGTFGRRADIPPTTAPPIPDTTTLRQFVDLYLERRGTTATKNDASYIKRIIAFVPTGQRTLGDHPVTGITDDQWEMFYRQLQREGRAAGTLNKYRLFLTRLLKWGVKKKYITHNAVVDSDTIKHSNERGARRTRRLAREVADENGRIIAPGEERRLLAAANPSLQRLIIGALETGMRRGELLNLKWQDVDLKERKLTVRAETSKTRVGRSLPISARLAAVLEMAKTDPGGKDFQPSDYVFGDTVGRKVKDTKKTWETTVLKAHGFEPKWMRTGLSPESRARLRAINLHFHDLRHEAGSRFIEDGWQIHAVREMLGHASLEQTTTYLNITFGGLAENMRRTDESRSRCNPVANDPLVEHPPVCNDGLTNTQKSLVN